MLIYDPTLVGLDQGGTSQNLAVESALTHPDIPILVTAFSEAEAEAAPGVMARAENVVIAAQHRAEILLQVNQLVARATDVAGTCAAVGLGGR